MEKNFNAKSYLNWLINMGKLPRIEEGIDIEEYAENAQRVAEDEGLSLLSTPREYMTLHAKTYKLNRLKL